MEILDMVPLLVAQTQPDPGGIVIPQRRFEECITAANRVQGISAQSPAYPVNCSVD
jgi:hypothetical protein